MNAFALRDAAERAVSTAAQTAVAVIGVDAATQHLSIVAVDWPLVAGAAALAGVLSVLKSLAALGTTGTPSLALKDPTKRKRGEHVAE
ncbi:holin [Curtobacterium flaccumfaciens]|uniref:holin n=1 Tax=Curtobacterium flaccumfaciens TaxID=2035 RepID=UPI00265AA6A0|nr:holin [Curtobacterium flaccumfaciens]MCS0491195.1 holin [Curtobacterium flaccumfaciens pv. betae]